MKNSTLKFVLGMPEFMLLSGIYIYADAKYLGLSLIILGACSGFGRYCMDRNDEDQKDKETKKLIKDMTDSVTALSLSKAVPSSNKSGGFH
jgi:hypothetical protein